jgi:cytochrome c553
MAERHRRPASGPGEPAGRPAGRAGRDAGRPGPPRWTAWVAGALLLPLAAAAGKAGDPKAGRTKADACVTCHGPLGLSQAPDAPHLAGQPALYLAEQLKAYRSGKRSHEVMGVVAQGLTDADIADLAAWYASIEVRAGPAR